MEISINETFDNAEEAADCLREIARLLSEGYTSGYSPTWTLTKE